MAPSYAASGDSTDILAVANSPVLWICAVGVFAVIFVQSVIYIRAARAAGPDIGMTRKHLNGALRAGAIASIGPSLAVVLVAITLIAIFGTPAVLVRIGLIGSAATEVASATLATSTTGAELGGPDYTQRVFVIAFTAMTLSGAMWMLATLILTPVLKRGNAKLQKMNKAATVIIPSAALLAAFISIATKEMAKSSNHIIVLAVSGGVMAICLLLAKRLEASWLKEWALGIALVVAVAVALLLPAAA